MKKKTITAGETVEKRVSPFTGNLAATMVVVVVEVVVEVVVQVVTVENRIWRSSVYTGGEGSG